MHIITIDLEDWYHLLDCDSVGEPDSWDSFPSLLEPMTEQLLDLFSSRGVRATFFCLGWIARKYPDLLRRIRSFGHDIGTHSDTHLIAYSADHEVFREDLLRSIRSIENAISEKVEYYRAPGFSIRKDGQWIFDILAESGITVDCSVLPTKGSHGGIPGSTITDPCLIRTKEASIVEFPIKPVDLFGQSIIVSGGGYFRLLPYRSIHQFYSSTDYSISYFHPRDFWPNQPRLPGLTSLRIFKSYYGLAGSFNKLKKVLNDFKFISISQALQKMDLAALRLRESD